MSFKIYTKTGDLGKTSLLGGTKVSKANIRIESYGTVDELNSYIGLVNDLFHHEETNVILKEIQDRLFTVGSTLACDPEKSLNMSVPDLHEEDIILLEKEIDRMTAVLPEMKSFILPGGHPTVSQLHIARCVCRRAERICVGMQDMDLVIEPIVIRYLNRLSDYLFTLARFAGHELKIVELKWKARI